MRAVMLMFDTLSRSFLPNYGSDWVHAPNFERLGEKSIQFENFYAGSLPCMPARRELHTGRYNFMHRMWGQLEPFDNSIFDTLQKNNIYSHLVTDHSHYFEDGGATYHNRYSTWEGFRGQEGDRWVPRALADMTENANKLNKKGISPIQHFANRTRQQNEEDFSSVLTIEAGLEFIENYKDINDWFLQIECFDPHEPFYVPERFRKLYYDVVPQNQYFWPVYGEVQSDITSEDLNQLSKEYAALVSMCDYYLGKVLDLFDKEDLWKDTLLIVNTDHGFLVGEHGWLGKNISPLYQEIVHLPLFVSHPDYQGKSTNHTLAQTIDLPATILDYFNIDNKLDMDGKSILPALDESNKIHDEILFGINGGFVNIYDGRYLYMRSSQTKDNGPRKVHTLNFNHARGFLTKEELDTMVLKKGSRFTNSYPYLEIDIKEFVDTQKFGNLLFDLLEDPHQQNPIVSEEIESRLCQTMVDIMQQTEVPHSEYTRLGLTNYLKGD